jgi:TPR repeat protein
VSGIPLAARIVEVIADLGDDAHPRYRYGSGCIVRGRTVLTAAHVVTAARAVQVRYPDKTLRRARADARFVGGDAGPDLALVDIDDEIDLPAIELAVVDRDSAAAAPVENCHVVGYPWFAETPSPAAVRDTVDAWGHVPVLSKLASGLLTVQVTVLPEPLPPERTALGESPWSGISGAPVVAGEYLLGVVSEHAPRAGPSAITAVPLSALERDPAHPEWGPGVSNAGEWWARLGVTGLKGLRRLPLAPLAGQLGHDLLYLRGQRLEGVLAQLAGQVGTLARTGSHAGMPRKPVRLLPRPALLAGREELLTELGVRLPGGDPGPQTVVLCGLGGIGKSSLALEYAHRHLAEVGVAWQFSADDPAVLTAGFGELAAQLGLRDVFDTRDPVASVHSVLAAFPDEWLLVFDNAPSWASVEKFLPPAGRGKVLITSQNQHWPYAQALQVPVLGTKVAADFLASRAGDPDQQAAAELAGELDGLPLALEQAGAYIHATGTNLAGYLSMFRERRADMLTRGEAAGHPANVAATLSLALSRLTEETPAAVGLARLLACLAPEPVPLALLFADAQIASQLAPDVAAAAGLLVGDAVAVADTVAALRRYSLVTPAGDGLVLMHRLVQAVALAQVPADVADQWEQGAAALVEAAVPADSDLPAAWPVCAVLLPHARAVLSPASAGIWRIADYLGNSGSYLTAQELCQQSADTLIDVYGPEHLDTLVARSNLARWALQAGKAAEARDQYAVLLPLVERVAGAEDPVTLTTRHNLAASIGEAGDAAGARDQLAAVLSIEEQVLGAEHPLTLTTRSNLARWAAEAGDTAGARDQFAAQLSIEERILGPEHRDTLTTRNNLAYMTGLAGDAAKARDHFAALVPTLERVLGSEHPDTLLARGNLARWTGKAGNAAAARDQFTVLLPIFEHVLGPEHPDTLTTRGNLADWTGEARDAAAARDQYAALLPIEKQVLGPEHPRTLLARCNLANWTGKAGDAAAARDQYAVLLAIHEQVLGPEHPDTLTTRRSLRYWTRKARGWRRIIGARKNLGVPLEDNTPEQDRNRYERAAQAGDTHAMDNHGLLFLKDSEREQAQQWSDRAQAGDISAMNCLGILLEDSDPKQARHWFERAAQADHTGAMKNLGVLLKRSDPERARHWYERAAQAGDIGAMNSLGALLEDSAPEQARHWYERAAQAGDIGAMNSLGILLKDSDPEQARKWWQKVAQAGHTGEQVP